MTSVCGTIAALILSIATLQGLNAIRQFGTCPQFSPVEIVRRDLAGDWFAIKTSERAGRDDDDHTQTCLKTSFRPMASETGIEFEILSAFYDGENFQSKSVRAKQVYPNSEWSSGAFQLNLADLVEPLIPNSGDPQDPDSEDYDDEESMYPHPNFLILYVDESFLVVSYCDQIEPLVKNEQMWILSREQFPNIEKVGRVESKLFHTEIDNFQMFEVDQETCSSSEMRQKFPFRALLRVGDDPFESDQAYLKYLTCLNQATTMIQIDLCVNYLNMGFFGH